MTDQVLNLTSNTSNVEEQVVARWLQKHPEYATPDLHVYHHAERGVKITIEVEKGKGRSGQEGGIGWRISVQGAESVEVAMQALELAEARLNARYAALQTSA
jgi:hypothetical protein